MVRKASEKGVIEITNDVFMCIVGDAASSCFIAEVGYKVTAATGVPVSQVNVFIDSMNMD